MTLYEGISIGVALCAVAVALWALRHAGRSARAAERSASAAEAAHRLALRPYVVAEVAQRTRVVGPQGRTRAEIVLVNRGNGIALDISGDLRMAHSGGEAQLQVPPCSALGKGDEHVVPGMPSSGAVELWGEIVFRDTEGGTYRVAKGRGEGTWRLM